MRVENALVSYLRYLGKSFWPADLAMPYPYPSHWPNVWVWIAVLVLLVWTATAIYWGPRLPFILVGSGWFLGMLVPVIGLVQVGGQSMADRYTYLPQIGLWVVLVWGGADLVRRWRVPQSWSPYSWGWGWSLLQTRREANCGIGRTVRPSCSMPLK